MIIQEKKDENTKGRLVMLRNVWEVQFREPYARYYIMREGCRDIRIDLNKKLQVSWHCERAEAFVKANGYESVQDFTDKNRKDIHGFYK
jgi:hypothetical protein